MRRLGAIWRTTAARLALGFTVFFSLGLGLALGLIYLGTITVVDRQTDATLEAEVRALSEQFRTGGLARLVTAVNARSGPDARGDNVYLLAAASGRGLAGNLNGWPVVEPVEGWVRFEVSKRDGTVVADRQVRARVFDLPGDYRLLVGRDNEELEAFRERFLRVALWVALGTVALGLLAGLMLGHRVLARVAGVAEAGERIAAGHLDRRGAGGGPGGEEGRAGRGGGTTIRRAGAAGGRGPR